MQPDCVTTAGVESVYRLDVAIEESTLKNKAESQQCQAFSGVLVRNMRSSINSMRDLEGWGGFRDDFRTCLVTQGSSFAPFDHIETEVSVRIR
jgi:hypothetical protein